MQACSDTGSTVSHVTSARLTRRNASTEVRLVRIEGGTHDWAGLEASQMVWEFFAGLGETSPDT